MMVMEEDNNDVTRITIVIEMINRTSHPSNHLRHITYITYIVLHTSYDIHRIHHIYHMHQPTFYCDGDRHAHELVAEHVVLASADTRTAHYILDKEEFVDNNKIIGEKRSAQTLIRSSG